MKITSDNQVFCFKANPSPGFSYYEANTSQPISAAVARFLPNEDEASLASPCNGC
jgi:hypothetical protein